MQWKQHLTGDSKIDNSWEPLELRSLKRQLANLKCDCSSCEKYSRSVHPFTTSTTSPWPQDDQQSSVEVQSTDSKDQEVQSLQSKDSEESFKPTVQLVNTETITDDIYIPASFPSFNNNMCSNCFFTLSLLRSGTTKVLKDEEIEIKPEVFLCDKATNKMVKCLEKTTSYCKPLLKHPNNIRVQSEDSFYSQNRSVREVTFAFNDRYYDDTTQSEPSVERSISTENFEEEEETSSTVFENAPEFQDLSPPVPQLCKNWIDVNEYINTIKPPAPYITKNASFD